MENLNKITHLFLSKLGNLEGKTILCGFSSGADSTSLLHTLIQKRDFFKYNLKAVFFSHGDNPICVDGDKKLLFCQNFCLKYHVPLEHVDLQLEKIPRQGWESSGRKARQNFYDTQNCDYIFLGHHQDDQDETTMIQLLRGGGKGASAMLPQDGIYCRPFLKVHKQDLYDYLKNQNISWIEDPTNQDTDFTRNFWRHIGLPTIAKHYPQYSNMLENFREKNRELNDLSYELAVNDGLLSLLNHDSVDIKKISSNRLKNLMTHYFNLSGKHMENSFFIQQIAHYQSNHQLHLQHKGIELSLYKGTFYPYLYKPTTTKKNKP